MAYVHTGVVFRIGHIRRHTVDDGFETILFRIMLYLHKAVI